MRKIKPYTKYWQKLANELLMSYFTVYPCKKCGHPVLDGYCCLACGDKDPSNDEEQ